MLTESDYRSCNFSDKLSIFQNAFWWQVIPRISKSSSTLHSILQLFLGIVGLSLEGLAFSASESMLDSIEALGDIKNRQRQLNRNSISALEPEAFPAEPKQLLISYHIKMPNKGQKSDGYVSFNFANERTNNNRWLEVKSDSYWVRELYH